MAAYQIAQERVFGNLRKKGTAKPRHENSNWRDQRDGMDSDHCAAVRQCPCATCPRTPAGTIHHLKSGPAKKERGANVRATDKRGIPECWFCHHEIENAGPRKEIAYYKDHGIADVHELAGALWRASPDVAKMTAILIAHKEQS